MHRASASSRRCPKAESRSVVNFKALRHLGSLERANASAAERAISAQAPVARSSAHGQDMSLHPDRFDLLEKQVRPAIIIGQGAEGQHRILPAALLHVNLS
ncbi:unnamed protein product [Polarella glacialis]|uniref:Uncharacterized protein n=1 Tax=Polarella glacialis TaxID=89957 RepID=A0A813LXU6_POLGL|nr:unnamed protein product [Polarella glacialis]